jgi:signal transduction histidine kinase
MSAELATERQRARFEAVRRRVFEEMHEVASRRRLAMIVPYHLFVFVVLAARGEPPIRLAIQTVAAVVFLGALSFADKTVGARSFGALAVACASTLVWIGNTGGLASPLLPSTLPFLMASSMHPMFDRRRFLLLAMMLLGFAALACCAHTALGELAGPLAPHTAWASSEYVMLSLASTSMAAVASFKMGRAVSMAYERIALELAVRREELCDESEGRTRALEGIAARLAHEVKNPLAAIKGLSTHVARQATDPKVKERLSIVAAEAERLQEIVDGFLSFSRGLDDLEISPTKPYDIVRELALLLETRAADAGVTLEVRGTRELSLNADTKKLRQALLNLVLNAMQASSKGSTVTLEVAKSCADGAAVIKVMDRGQGMTPDILERIRKPYFTTKEGGSGLGIAVARGIIEQHGGNLRFESTSGRGTTATVTLPACAMDAQKGRAKLPMCRVAHALDKAAAAVAGGPADAPEKPAAAEPALAAAAPDPEKA